MPRILIFAALVAIGAIAYMTTDEQLSPLASEFIDSKTSDSSEVSRAYRILLGMHAAKEDNAFDVGSRSIADFLQASANAGVLDKIGYPEYPDQKKIFVPSSDENDLYCAIRASGCLDQIGLDRSGRDKELERLSTLVERYSEYLSANDYRTEIGSFVNEPWPDFRYLFVASRMNIFSAFNTAENGNVDAAIATLLEESRLLRATLMASDTVIHKVMTLALLRDNLGAVAYIHSLHDAHQMEPIPFLTRSERSFYGPLQREFTLIRKIAEEADGNPELLSYEFETPAWLGRLIFRPNMLINTVAERIDRQIILSQVKQAAFSAAVDELNISDDRMYSIVPSVNDAMVVMSGVDYTNYVARAFDINVKIELVNAQITGNPNLLNNPYYPDDEVKLHEDDYSVCMDGPLPDERRYRCLHVFEVPEEFVSSIGK